MCEQIRVPLDGSALAERALPCATRLAQTTGATLHLVRAVEPLPGALSSYGHVIVHDRYIDAAVRVATEFLDAVRARLLTDGVRVQTRTPIGNALDALLEEERRAGINLVVMCSRRPARACRCSAPRRWPRSSVVVV
jgi:nucleotide-binding universal stress UspA family protein